MSWRGSAGASQNGRRRNFKFPDVQKSGSTWHTRLCIHPWLLCGTTRTKVDLYDGVVQDGLLELERILCSNDVSSKPNSLFRNVNSLFKTKPRKNSDADFQEEKRKSLQSASSPAIMPEKCTNPCCSGISGPFGVERVGDRNLVDCCADWSLAPLGRLDIVQNGTLSSNGIRI